MKIMKYWTLDKQLWSAGKWHDEPDKMQWADKSTGLPCLIVRGPVGALCGYVGVPLGHHLHGVGYEDHEGLGDVHGGLTFSNACLAGADEATDICHVADKDEPDNIWWFGFDCAHAGDFYPYHGALREPFSGLYDDEGVWPTETYKTVGYVQEQCAKLALSLGGAAQ